MGLQHVRWAMTLPPHCGLTPTQRHVLTCLAYHASEDDGEAYPAVATVVAETGLSMRAVETALGAISRSGLVRKADTGRRSRSYFIPVLADAPQPRRQQAVVTVEKSTPAPDAVYPAAGAGQPAAGAPAGDAGNPAPDAVYPAAGAGQPAAGADEEERKKEVRVLPTGVSLSAGFLTQAVEAWNAICPPKLPKVSKLTDQRRKALRARLADDFGDDLDRWRAYLRRIIASPFLTGGNDRGWTADFDWAVKSANAVKVLEGKYDQRTFALGGSSSRDASNPHRNYGDL